MRFGAEGRLRTISDRNGNQIALGYEGEALERIVDAAGREVAVGSDEQGRLSGFELPDGRQVTFSYDGDGRLNEVTDLRGNVTEYDYDDEDRLTKITNQRGETVVESTYDDEGRVVSQLDGLEEETTFSWEEGPEEGSGTQVMTDARGNQWTDVYERGALIERRDPLGNATTYRWDADLNVREMYDPRGQLWRFDYDDRGNLVKSTAPQPLGYVARITYNERNDPTSYTDPAGEVSTVIYDPSGNLSSFTDPTGRTTRMETDGRGLPVAVTDPTGDQITARYDDAGNLRPSPQRDRTAGELRLRRGGTNGRDHRRRRGELDLRLQRRRPD